MVTFMVDHKKTKGFFLLAGFKTKLKRRRGRTVGESIVGKEKRELTGQVRVCHVSHMNI
jgi:hypothetical protein